MTIILGIFALFFIICFINDQRELWFGKPDPGPEFVGPPEPKKLEWIDFYLARRALDKEMERMRMLKNLKELQDFQAANPNFYKDNV